MGRTFTTFPIRVNGVSKEDLLKGDFSERLIDDYTDMFEDSGYEVTVKEAGDLVDNGGGETQCRFGFKLDDEIAKRYFFMTFSVFSDKEKAELLESELLYDYIDSDDFDKDDCQFIEFSDAPYDGGSALAVNYRYNKEDAFGEFLGRVLDADVAFLDQWFENGGYVKGHILKS